MKPIMRYRVMLVVIVMGAVAFGAGLNQWLEDGPKASQKSVQTGPRIPLYWVAPMDPDYRRDQPGRSPMGMALVPVYKAAVQTSSGPGVIQISSEVINQLGVQTVAVTQRQLQTDLVTVGYVQYDETKLAHIHPRVSGWVEKLYVTAAGDPVEADMPLYALYAPELVNAQEELVIALKRANPPLIAAAEARLRALQVPDAVVQRLKKTLTVSQTVAFYAGQSGVVDNLNIREGFFVEPATTLMSIAQLESVWVAVDIPAQQAALVKPGDAITMTLDYFPGDVWLGTVGYIYPTLDLQTRTLRARVVLDNRDQKLRPNMFAKVLIHSRSRGMRMVIPKDALIRTGREDRAVLALGAGRFQSVSVRVGQVDDAGAEILTGLSIGDEVVINAQFLIDSESNKGADLARMGRSTQETVRRDPVDPPLPHQDHSMQPMTPGASKSGHLDHDASEPDAPLKPHPALQDHAANAGPGREGFDRAMPEVTTGLHDPHAGHGETKGRGRDTQAAPPRPNGNGAHHEPAQQGQSHDHSGRGSVTAPSRQTKAANDVDAQSQGSGDGAAVYAIPAEPSVAGGVDQRRHQLTRLGFERGLDLGQVRGHARGLHFQRRELPQIGNARLPSGRPARVGLPS